MAIYLASFNIRAAASNDTASAPALDAQSAAQERTLVGPAQRLFTTACGAGHHDGDGPVLLGQNNALALNRNLHSARPDNLLHVILEGIHEPATKDIGFMRAFRHNLNDAQVAQLAAWMRQRFAPGKPAWRELEMGSARVREASRRIWACAQRACVCRSGYWAPPLSLRCSATESLKPPLESQAPACSEAGFYSEFSVDNSA